MKLESMPDLPGPPATSEMGGVGSDGRSDG